MGWSEVANTVCPVARSLAVVGDRWTVLILRELFLGVKKFEEFQVQTGMSSHLLSSRLKRLTEDGIIARHQYTDRPTRYEYRLTNKGLDLYPLILSLKSWGERWAAPQLNSEKALVITHNQCGHEVNLQLFCPTCSSLFGPKDTNVTLGSHFKNERKERQEGK